MSRENFQCLDKMNLKSINMIDDDYLNFDLKE